MRDLSKQHLTKDQDSCAPGDGDFCTAQPLGISPKVGSLCGMLRGMSWVVLLPRDCTTPEDLSEKLLMEWMGNEEE